MSFLLGAEHFWEFPWTQEGKHRKPGNILRDADQFALPGNRPSWADIGAQH
jgi:hypothetical protein